MATGITTPLSPGVVSPVFAASVKEELACDGSAAVARSALRMMSQHVPSALHAAIAWHFDTIQLQVAFEDPAFTCVRVTPGYMGQPPPASSAPPDDCPPLVCPEPDVEPELVPELEPDVCPELELEPEPEVEPEPVLEPELVPEPDVCPEPDACPKPEVEPEPDVCPEPEPIVFPELVPDDEVDPPDDADLLNGGAPGASEHPTTTTVTLAAVSEAKPMAVRNPNMVLFLLSPLAG
jgi:hypothetical protein